MSFLHKKLFPVIVTILIFLSQQVSAQQNSYLIKGRIVTPDGNPAYVTVTLKQANKTAATDNNGYFRLKGLLPLHDTLVITSVESQTYLHPLATGKAGTINLGDIHLQFQTAQLQTVEVKGRLAHSYKSDYSFSGTKTQTPLVQIPQSISSVTKEMIQDRMNFTLKDVATEAAGISAYSGYDEYTIRGFRAENARLINGLRGYNTTYTSNMLVNIERIEIIKGPTATLYGNGDPGGTINLVTKKPLEQKEKEITLSAGSWHHIRAGADITGPVNKKKTILYRFNAGYDNTQSFRDLWYAKSYQLAPSFSLIPNNKIQFNVDVSVSHINTLLDRGQPGFQGNLLRSTPIQLTTSQPGDYLHETSLASNVLFSYKINKNISFNSGYLNYITQQNVAEHGIQSYITPDSVNLYQSRWNYHTVTNTFTNYVVFHFNTGKLSHQLLTGHDLVTSNVNLNQNYFELPDRFGQGSGVAATFSLRSPVYINRDTKAYQLSAYNADASDVDAAVYRTQGVYLQDQISVNKWKLLLGLRQEMYRASGDDDDAGENTKINRLTPRIGLVYQLKPAASLYVTCNQGFDAFEVSASTQQFSQPFKPITSQLWEAGVKANVFSNRLYASLALYQLTLQHVAVNANDISNPNLFIQQGEERSRGIETEINGNLLPNLSFFGSYAYCVATITESKVASQIGTPTDNAPKHVSNTWLKYTIRKGALKGLAIAAGHAQVSKRNTLEPNFTLPGYITINAGLRYAWQRFTFAANLNNITNKTYWTGAYNNIYKWPGALRNGMFEIRYRF